MLDASTKRAIAFVKESGAHSIELSTWESFAKRAKQRLPRIAHAIPRADLKSVVAKMNASFGANATLPW